MKNKKVKLNIILKPVLYIVFAIIFEIVSFLWLKFKMTGNTSIAQILPTYFFFDFGIMIIIAGLIFVSGKIGGNIIMYVFLSLQAILNITNATLYKVFGDIFSFDMLKLGIEAANAFKFEFLSLWSIFTNVLIMAVIITSQILIDKKAKKEFEMKKLNTQILSLIVAAGCFVVGITSFIVQSVTLKTGPNITDDDKYLWNYMEFKLEAYKKFGTYGFYVKSIADLIFPYDEYNEEIKEEILKNLSNGRVKEDTSAPLYDDNLIVIMLESFEWFAIDPINTPTLWKLRTEDAISFENYYSKNKTNMSEDIVILGDMPNETSMTKLAKQGFLNTEYSLPNLFKERGYDANYFHSYLKTFYNRNEVNAGMGFDNLYCLDDVEIENKSTSFNDWNLDSDICKFYISEMCPTDKNFFSFFLTVTTHGSYARTNERFNEYYAAYDENLETYKDWLKENTSYVYPSSKDMQAIFRQYKCAAMDTDKMIAYLLEYLSSTQDDNGEYLIDKTDILMYADHNSYYEDLCYNIKGISKADFYDTYSYNVPCMLYSKKITPKINTTFANTYDLYPTICSLFGLSHNTALTQGYDIFGDEIYKSVKISYTGGAFNENCYTLNVTDVYVTDQVTEDDLKHFRECVTLFYHKQHDIELMYRHGLLVKRAE